MVLIPPCGVFAGKIFYFCSSSAETANSQSPASEIEKPWQYEELSYGFLLALEFENGLFGL
jgi:hypothetical protein